MRINMKSLNVCSVIFTSILVVGFVTISLTSCKQRDVDQSQIKQQVPSRIDALWMTRPLIFGSARNSEDCNNNCSSERSNNDGSYCDNSINYPSNNERTVWVEDYENRGHGSSHSSGSSAPNCTLYPAIDKQDENIHIQTEDALRVQVLSSEVSAKIYNAMIGSDVEPYEIDGTKYRRVLYKSNVGEQNFEFLCGKVPNEDIYGCDLYIEKLTGNGRKSYKAHPSKRDGQYYIVRNDTDYSDAVKPLWGAFQANTSKKQVNAGIDSDIGYNTCGGQEFTIPDDSSAFRIVCRSDGNKTFCKFIVKIPE